MGSTRNLDRTLLAALSARMEVEKPRSRDEAVIALRAVLKDAGDLPRDLVRVLWSRLEARSAGPVSVWGPLSALLAADRYGHSVRSAHDPEAALKAAREGGRAVLDLGRSTPWWARLLAQPDLRVTAALPDDASGRPLALVVSGEEIGPTGEDRTFWVIEAPGDEAKITDLLAQRGLAGAPLETAGGLKLFMLAGYVQPDDGRLIAPTGRLSGVIGAAPVF